MLGNDNSRERTFDSIWVRRSYLRSDNLPFERAEHHHPELNLQSGQCASRQACGKHTVDVDIASSMADQTVRGLEQIPDADAEADFLHDLVGVLFMDFVFDLIAESFVELMRGHLNQILKFRLS